MSKEMIIMFNLLKVKALCVGKSVFFTYVLMHIYMHAVLDSYPVTTNNCY